MNEVEHVSREMTFEEEAVLFEKEARELFATEEETEGESPAVNCLIRRGMRIIRKARIALREKAERDKRCPYCERSVVTSNIEVTVSDLVPDEKGGLPMRHFRFIEPNFCPMCGKRLEVKHEAD